MVSLPSTNRRAVSGGWRAVVAALFVGCSLAVAVMAAEPALDTARPAAARPGGVDWDSLSATQKSVLGPLQRDWPTIEASSRDKWLEVAARFPTMPATERQRVQDRMAEWARLTPAEKTQARLQFQEARQVSPEDRQSKWEAYQALPEQQRRELANRARPAPSGPARTGPDVEAKNSPAADSKRNMVQTQRSTVAKPVTPTMVQANPGATTRLMSSPPSPPAHNQPGLPKIAAMEGFVNPATLLPKRGPQGAAVQAAKASQPAAAR